ncbi:MAG: hypothetical protein EOM80_08620 [Erysipelotrichia bacterium]|nr:hypothetical protein [Erysipelotrichia bacterium]
MKEQDRRLYFQDLERAVATRNKAKLVIKQIEELGEQFTFPHSEKYLSLYEEYDSLIKKMDSLPRLPFEPFNADVYEIKIEEELISRRREALEWAKENNSDIVAELEKYILNQFDDPATQVRRAATLRLIESELDQLDSLTVLNSILSALKSNLQIPEKIVAWLDKKLLPLRLQKKPSFDSEESFGELPKNKSIEILFANGTALKIFTILVEAEKNTDIKLSKHSTPRNAEVNQTYEYISRAMKSKYDIGCKPGQIKAILDMVEKWPKAKKLYLLAKNIFDVNQDLKKINI